jgi:dihydrofolate reductase
LPGAEVFADLQSALASCSETEDVYIIGGESVYRQAMPIAHRLCLTEIDAVANQADAFFPPVDHSEWKETFRDCHEKDEKHDYNYSFVDYVR